MKLAKVPGAGVALIEDGKIVYEGGLGVKEIGKPDKVDANTLFMAASNTKGMTTLLLAMLADQKKLRWDQPVKELFPAFRLGDEETTKQVQVRHLVCACTGMPRQDYDWLFEFQGHTAKSSIDMLGTMKPTSKFGEVFQYSNLMVSAAGYAAAHLTSPGKELGAGYDAAMEKFVFQPLGMKSTTFSMSAATGGNHAKPHGENFAGATTVLPMTMNHSVVPHRPAGGVWTSAHDFARYVLLELNKGMMDGKRVVSEANLLERRKPQIATGEKSHYAMGFGVTTRNGVEVVRHGGSLFGYKSDLVFLPEVGVGAVILTNADNGGYLLGPFVRKLEEMLFDGRPEAKQNLQFAMENQKKSLAKLREIYALPAEAGHVEGLEGRYRNASLGELTVKRQGGELVFDLGEWASPMASRKDPNGILSFMVAMPELMGLEFVRGGTKDAPTIITRDAQHEYVFERRP
jgi:CubicO group peptidase (beta-lactamase class C family)